MFSRKGIIGITVLFLLSTLIIFEVYARNTTVFTEAEEAEFMPNELLLGYLSDHLTDWDAINALKEHFGMRRLAYNKERRLERLFFPHMKDMERI